MIISGHRREYAAGIAGLKEVPCIVREFKSDEDKELVFLISNQFREKSLGQRINEFLHLKKHLRKIGKLFMNDEVKASLNTVIESSQIPEEIIEKSLFGYLTDLNIDPGEPLNSIDIIERETGLSEWMQRMVNVVFDDDYLGKVQRRLEAAKVKPETWTDFYRDWIDIRSQVQKGDMTLGTAFQILTDRIAQAEKTGKKKKAPKPAPKPKPEPPRLFYELPKLRETWSQMPMQFQPESSTIDYCLKYGSADVGIVRTMNTPVGICINVDGVARMINFHELVKQLD
jgi:hypothetical protein